MAKSKEKDAMNGVMVAFTMENGKTTKSVGTVSTVGLMVVDFKVYDFHIS